MRERRWLLLTLYGLLIAIAVSDALKATRPKFKIATTSTTTTTTTEEPAGAESADDTVESITAASTDTNATTGHTLTGIPQIDYIWDPNLPRELNGYNLSDYPFYASMPEDIDFKCDGLHDGFYASVPHKCQVYHHCLYGTRYDFLCANFTAFDQKTFICHFVSEVDCANSKKYWHRNDALYQAATTTTTSTTTTTTTTTQASVNKGDRLPARRRRPPPRRPAYDYYDEDYYDDDYGRGRPRGYNRRDYDDYEDTKYRRDRNRDIDYRHRDLRDRDKDRHPMRGNRRDPARARDPVEDDMPRTRLRDQDPSRIKDVEDRVRDGDERRYFDKKFRDDYDEKDSGPQLGSNEGLVKPAAPPSSVYARPRAPPKLRRPVPLSEQDKYSYSTSTTARAPADEPRRRPVPVDDVDEPRRRPAAIDDVEEPRRRPVPIDDLDEPRRRPVVENSEEPRRRPVDLLDDDDYYEDEMEEVRPRWQIRGRPLRDRDFPDKRYRDRPFRPRYRDEEDDVRPRKHPERSRDRFYERDRERGRDRSLDRTKDRSVDRDRTAPRAQDPDKSDRPSIYSRPADRDRENERPRTLARSKEPQEARSKEPQEPHILTEAPKKFSIYDRSTTEKPVVTTTTEEPEKETTNPYTAEQRDRSQKFSFVTQQPKSEAQPTQQQQQQQQQPQKQQQQKHSQPQYHKTQETTTEREPPQKYWKPIAQTEHQNRENEEQQPVEEYPSEYYDEVEEPAIVPMPPPRPTVRVVKRPFLPSRGGNPNPRGLSPVGSKAQTSPRREENPIKHYIKLQTTTASNLNEEGVKVGLQEDYQRNQGRDYDSNKQIYNGFKNAQQSDLIQKQHHQQINDNYDVPVSRPALRRPESDVPKRGQEIQEVTVPQKATPTWHTDYAVQEQNNEANNQGIEQQQSRGNIRHQQTDKSNLFSSSYKTDDAQEQLAVNGNYKVKQKINEVTDHNLQDIPESEYDVTLNEALTPNLSQEPNLPSGFVLPLHRQLGRDAILQPSENSYKFSRPINQQQHQYQKQQLQQQSQQQTAYHSPQLENAQLAQTSAVPRNADRGKTVYFRTPETIQISGAQYRQQRGHWGDYTGF